MSEPPVLGAGGFVVCPPAKSARSDIDGPFARPRSFGRGSGAPRGVGDPSRTAIRFVRDGEFGARPLADGAHRAVSTAAPASAGRWACSGPPATGRRPGPSPGRPSSATTARARATATATDKPSAWDLGPNPYAIESPGGGAKRRELDANPYAEENDPVTLSNPRFAKVPQLAKIAGGKAS